MNDPAFKLPYERPDHDESVGGGAALLQFAANLRASNTPQNYQNNSETRKRSFSFDRGNGERLSRRESIVAAAAGIAQL
jgi:sugar (pentulose or hexulose) kinase